MYFAASPVCYRNEFNIDYLFVFPQIFDILIIIFIFEFLQVCFSLYGRLISIFEMKSVVSDLIAFKKKNAEQKKRIAEKRWRLSIKIEIESSCRLCKWIFRGLAEFPVWLFFFLSEFEISLKSTLGGGGIKEISNPIFV